MTMSPLPGTHGIVLDVPMYNTPHSYLTEVHTYIHAAIGPGLTPETDGWLDAIENKTYIVSHVSVLT